MLSRVIPQSGGLVGSRSVPVSNVDSLLDEAFSVFGRSFLNDRAVPSSWSVTTFAPPADVIETEDRLQVSLDMPGHDPKTLQAKLEGDTLTVQAERRQNAADKGASYLLNERGYGLYSRSFVLPRTVDAGKCEAHYEHGVLTLTFPKREEAKSRTIEINVRS